MTIIAPLIDSGSVRDYEWLKTAVADWLHKSNLTSRIPDFIRFAEGTINRKLNIAQKEIEASLVAVVGSRFVALPSDFASPVELTSTYIQPRHEFTPVIVSEMDIDDVNRGLAYYWAIDGSNIAFERPADQAYPLRLRYIRTLYLSEASTTNALLTAHPDLYLYGALAHSAPYIRDDPRLPMWESTFRQILKEVKDEANRSKSMAPLQCDPALTNRRRGNIITGD